MTISEKAFLQQQAQTKKPLFVLKIATVPYLIGTNTIKAYWYFDEPHIFFDLDGLFLDLPFELPDDKQKELLSKDSMNQEISQQIIPETGQSSVSYTGVTLIDFGGEATRLATRGMVTDDILGKTCEVFTAMDSDLAGFPKDYYKLFTGILDEIDQGQGTVKLSIASPEQLKRQLIYRKIETKLNLGGPLTPMATTIPLESTAGILLPTSADPAFETYIQIGDEIIKVGGISGNDLIGCTREQFDTNAVLINTNEPVSTRYRLHDTTTNLTLKLMMSGIGSFGSVSSGALFDGKTVFIADHDLVAEYNLQEFDTFTTTGAVEAGNNRTDEVIEQIVVTESGTTLTIGGADFTLELESPATFTFKSQYDTLPEGLAINPLLIDIERIKFYGGTFLASSDLDFLLDEDMKAKDFIDKEILGNSGAYSLVRQGRSSVGFHAAPLPTTQLKRIDKTKILNPGQLKVKRGLSKNFYNTVTVKYDKSRIDDKYLKGFVVTNATSRSEIAVGTKPLVIESSGLRSAGFVTSVSNAKLNRYAFAAEYIEGIQLNLKDYDIEAGDIIQFDTTDLNITNSTTGDRTPFFELFEVVKRSIAVGSGIVKIDILKTTYTDAPKYSLISPSSYIGTGLSNSTFTIIPSFSMQFGSQEFRKWKPLAGASVKIRNGDFSIVENSTIGELTTNTVTLDTPLSFIPSAGMVMELSDYSFQPENIRQIYSFLDEGYSIV